ncbi:unnamed protein product, partial [marine sediment metagenome]
MWTYNLFEALRRLGVKDARQPDLVRDQVLQALVVGDVSHLASPVLAPMAWVGAQQASVALEYGSFQITSRGIGGCFVRQLIFSRVNTGANVWSIDTVDPLAVDPISTTLTNDDMGPTPVLSSAMIGTSTVTLAATKPA